MAFLKTLAALLIVIPLACAFSCPAGTQKLKLKYDQLEIYDYYEGCGSANTGNQYALLGSMTSLNCGVDGSPVIEITDYIGGSSNYIKKLCMNVHGAASVTVYFRTLYDIDPPSTTPVIPDPHFEDLSGTTGWTRFCVETGNDFHTWQWDIYVTPKNDGSEVKVKNAKLAACQFFVY